MKKALISFFVVTLAFLSGVTAYRFSITELSLETISNNSEYYDGKKVEFVSYIQVSSDFISRYEATSGRDFNVGDYFEKIEAKTFLDIKTNSINLDSLLLELSENYSVNHYKRAKVRVSGVIIDNCNKGIPCCFGKTMNLVVDKIEQLEPSEDYTLP